MYRTANIGSSWSALLHAEAWHHEGILHLDVLQEQHQVGQLLTTIACVCPVQALHDECLRGAKFVSRLLEALGADVKMAQPYDGKNPVVLGRLGNNPAHPTGGPASCVHA